MGIGLISILHSYNPVELPGDSDNNVRILPSTHLYTWVESSSMEKCLAEGHKYRAMVGFEPRG